MRHLYTASDEEQPVRTFCRRTLVRASKTLARIRNGEPVRICSLGNYLPAYVRHAAHFGFDCIWFDLEHRTMQPREVQALLAFFHLYDIDCMLRAPTLEKTGLYRYLEDGASGLMIPHVSTPERARELVQATRFPPIGDRGLDGAGLDSDFILRGGPDYPERANRETFLVVQIETPQAVENVDAIAATEGIDGLFVGPGDLGLRLKHGSGGLTLDDAFRRVAEAAAKHGKAWGTPAGSPERVTELKRQGAQLIAYGGDFMALKNALETWSAEFEQALRED